MVCDGIRHPNHAAKVARCGIHKTLRKGTRRGVASFPQLSFCACPPLSGPMYAV